MASIAAPPPFLFFSNHFPPFSLHPDTQTTPKIILFPREKIYSDNSMPLNLFYDSVVKKLIISNF